MASTTDIKNGAILKIDGGLWSVVEFQHVKPGKGGAFVRTKLRNVTSGKVVDRTFNAGAKIETATVDRSDYQYLYQDGEDYVFMDLKTYEDAEYLVLATKGGLVKKSRLSDYDTNRTAGLIAINLRDDDEVVSAFLVSPEDDILLISRNGMSLRFHANNESLRPMGRSTSGVTGMKFRDGDELISAQVVIPESFVFVVTEGGYAKRTHVEGYRVQGRNGFGIKVAKLVEGRGALVGGLIVSENDEVLVVMQSGKVVRTNVSEVPAKGRDTMGVIFAKPGKGDSIIGIARNQDRQLDEQKEDDAEVEATEESVINSEVVDTQENTPTTASTDVDGGN